MNELLKLLAEKQTKIINASKEIARLSDASLVMIEKELEQDVEIQLSVQEGKIFIEWNPFETGKDFDIQFQINGGKWHSVKWMKENGFYSEEMPSSEDGKFRIGNANNLYSKWKVKLCEGVWKDNEFFTDDEYIAEEEFVEKDEPDWEFLNGLWDSWNYSGDEFNFIKSKNATPVSNEYNFLTLSHRWKGKTRDQWVQILKGFESEIRKSDPDKTIILLQDEPLSEHHGFSLEETQFLYDSAKQIMPEYQFGFSFVRGTIHDEELPECDWISLAMYPFFRQDYPDIQIWSKQEFDNWFDDHISQAQEKHDGDIFVLGQGFYNPDSASDRKRKWRKPPLEAPQWYAEAIRRNKLKGVVWWVYSIDRDDTLGLEEMPEYFEGIRSLGK